MKGSLWPRLVVLAVGLTGIGVQIGARVLSGTPGDPTLSSACTIFVFLGLGLTVDWLKR